MKKAKRSLQRVEEANVLPVMNVMFLLIPALLLAMEVASMAAITVSSPRIADGGTESTHTTNNFQLKVRVASDGFWLKTNDAPVGEAGRPSVVLSGEDYDYAALEAMAQEIKAGHPDEATVYVTAEGDVPLQVIVGTMDALRGTDCKLATLGEGEAPPAACLFWNPVVQSL
jgi:biopolymer transport protein ExbD